MCSFWEYLFEKFNKFPRKPSPEFAYLNKVAGYLTLTGNVLPGNLWNFQSSFYRKHPHPGKCFDQKIFFKKSLIQFDIQWYVLPGIMCITEVWRPFTMIILVCTWFVRFTFLRDFFIWENVYVISIVLITHAVTKRGARGSSSESECSWNNLEKKQL